MANQITVTTPDGRTHRHTRETNSDQIEVRALLDGGLEVLRVHTEGDVRSWGGGVTRAGNNSEELLAAYPPGSTYVTR